MTAKERLQEALDKLKDAKEKFPNEYLAYKWGKPSKRFPQLERAVEEWRYEARAEETDPEQQT